METPLTFELVTVEPPVPSPARQVTESAESRRQDISVPPASDLDSRFFDSSTEALDHESGVAGVRRALIAAAAHRRAYLAQYVKGAVAFSAALCVIALAKTAFVRSTAGSDRSSAASVVRLAPPLATAIAIRDPEPPAAPAPEAASVDPPAAASGGAPAESAEVPSPAAASGAGAAALPTAPAGSAPAAGSAQALEPPAPSSSPPSHDESVGAKAPRPQEEPAQDPLHRAAEALQLRERARAALERGEVRKAIDAGERSVRLDGSDGEAWLVLGAAYQQGGDFPDARRCYRSCVEQAKRGPRSECAQMLH